LALLVKKANAMLPSIRKQRGPRLQLTLGLLRVVAFAFGLGVTLPTLAQTVSGTSLDITGQSTLQGDVVMCSGSPWIDVRCNGATGDGNHDDTAAINTSIATAITNGRPVHFSPGTYKVTSQITVDYAGQAGSGLRLISEGAVIDGRTIVSGPVLQIQCGGGTTGSPTGCFYFKEEGTLFVNGNTASYVVVFGKPDFSDAHNSAKIDHLIVNNASTAAGAGGCQFNYVLDIDLYAVCVSSGGAPLSRSNSREFPVPGRPRAPGGEEWCWKTVTTSATPSSPSTSKSRRPACRLPLITMGSIASYRPISTVPLR